MQEHTDTANLEATNCESNEHKIENAPVCKPFGVKLLKMIAFGFIAFHFSCHLFIRIVLIVESNVNVW